MGSVWLAERSDGRFEGRAAVKLLNVALLGTAGRGALPARRHAPRAAAHPHIARLLDAGVSPTGQPYLVLEYVEGEQIDRYCDEQRLGVEARIAPVPATCRRRRARARQPGRPSRPQAVERPVDADGQVKLLDFGIAKLLERRRPAIRRR